MEVFSKGIHRALVPLDSHLENVAGIELVESASIYRMLTQMDLLRFLKAQESELKGIMSRKIAQLGGVTDIIFGVSERAKVIEVIKCMKTASLNAVPIIEASSAIEEDHSQLINGKDRKLVGTFSSTDLRECPISQMQTWLHASVLDFIELLSTSSSHTAADPRSSPRELVTCHAESSLGEVIDKAVTKHVHRVWVVDRMGLLDGLVSLTDMTRMIRVSLL
ncbi:cystathionine beta-synthase (CBS) family protein [Actinidia rufa]|uniref:Cystathionine beta-synthase (CBS) family protein n=1 Tax=Actinidia rufa TaxID=165716 RepID=A0A7J0GM88_9ERIC|nr:cystathionine beta-synthase (CBS) family protein [Actinidia rufa]